MIRIGTYVSNKKKKNENVGNVSKSEILIEIIVAKTRRTDIEKNTLTL